MERVRVEKGAFKSILCYYLVYSYVVKWVIVCCASKEDQDIQEDKCQKTTKMKWMTKYGKFSFLFFIV